MAVAPCPMTRSTTKPSGKTVAPLGLERIVDDGLVGGGEFVLNFVEQRQEILNGADAGENVRVRTPLDQFFQLLDPRRPGPTRCSSLSGPAGSWQVPWGCWPVAGMRTRWKAMAPNENTSDASVTFRESDRASGDM